MTHGGSSPGHVLQRLTGRPDCGENPPDYSPNCQGRKRPKFHSSEDLYPGICLLCLSSTIVGRGVLGTSSTLIDRGGAMPGPWGSSSSSRNVPRKAT